MTDEEDPYEDSLVSQFETTLSIKPSGNDDDYDDDISMNYTIHSMRDLTMKETDQVPEGDDEEEKGYGANDGLLPKFITKSNTKLSLEISDRSSSRKSQHTSFDPKYEILLKPSPLIDFSLNQFNKVFTEFLAYNPHIEKDSPRLDREDKKTLVLLSPYSAEHAFGRQWVTKSYLATIFERPQRLLASCIGVAAAVTMYPFYYKIKNSEKRASIFASYVRKVHGRHWPKKLYELCLESYDKLLENKLEVPDDWNTGDIYLTPKTINAIEGVLGTIESGIDALFNKSDKENRHNLAFVVIRPPGHHSHACLPSGFCLLNNVQVGIEYAFETYGVTHCAILDIDLHHGDGSQDICWDRAGFSGEYGVDDEDENNPRDSFGKKFATYPKVGYFSLHDIKSYPTELGFATKENIKNASTCVFAHDLMIWNVHLQEWKTEEEFYRHYQTKYVAILNRANQFLNSAKKQYEQEYQTYLTNLKAYQKYLAAKTPAHNDPMEKPQPPPPFKPLIAISAGFDASEYENPQMQRHGVNVPTSFYAKFTKDVVKLAKIHTKGKVISFLEGGYSDGALSTGIFSHLIGLTDSENDDDDDDDLLWNESWGSQIVMKELTRGCKKNWTPYKKPSSELRIWSNEVIKLGRSMMPNAVLPSNHMYKASEVGKPSVNKIVKSLEESDRFAKVNDGKIINDKRILRSHFK